MMDKIYPIEPSKTVHIPKEGYNSFTIITETNDEVVVQLYNPNVKPEEPKQEEVQSTPEQSQSTQEEVI